MNFNTVLAMIAASTPDGRWSLLQAWLKQNPKWRKKIDYWSTLSSDQVMSDLEVWAIEEYGAGVSVLANDTMRLKIKSAIENLQTRYNARVAETQSEKEIKNVRTKRQVEKRSGQDPKGAYTRTKRTDQA